MAMRIGFAWVLALGAFAIVDGCRCGVETPKTVATPPAHDAGSSCAAYASPQIDGAFTVSGLATTRHRPIVILSSQSAWHGSAEGLPAVTVFEDGLVVIVQSKREGTIITEGHYADATELACSIGPDLATLGPRITTNDATDQPETSISYRVGEVWRSVTVVGPMEPRTHPEGFPDDAPPPAAFKKHYERLRALSLQGAHPFVRDTYRVTFTDFDYAQEDAPWPATVPAPPPLTPDPRWMGRPRSYEVGASDGTALRELIRNMRNTQAVKLPDGTLVSMSVNVRIPDQDYAERVMSCARWDVRPFGPCTK